MSKISLKTPKEIALITQGGKKLKKILQKLVKITKVGISLEEIEDRAWQVIEASGGKPAFAQVPGYQWATCININQGIVHGVPNQYRIKNGDIITIDLGLLYQGWNTDMSTTFQVTEGKSVPTSLADGEKIASSEVEKFLAVGRKALKESIAQAYSGQRFGHISQMMQKVIEKAGYTPIRSLTGHGIGRKLHEPPLIPCFLSGDLKSTPSIKTGMVFAIEVIYAMGSSETETDRGDNWTIRTKDGKIAAVFEKTIAIDDDGHLICT